VICPANTPSHGSVVSLQQDDSIDRSRSQIAGKCTVRIGMVRVRAFDDDSILHSFARLILRDRFFELLGRF
jgi:hypothetical protein